MDKPSGHFQNEGSPIAEPLPVPQMTGPSVNVISDSQCRIEFVVVLFLAVVPDLFNAVSSLLLPPTNQPFAYDLSYWLVRSAQVSAPVLYIMWRSGEGWGSFGLKPIRWVADGVWGLVLYGLASIGTKFLGVFVWPLIESIDKSGILPAEVSNNLPASSDGLMISGLLAIGLSNGFAEELITRGFFIPRLDQMLRSRLLSVVFSTLLFASYHMYQGAWGTFSSVVVGALFGFFFSWKRRLWPVVIAHAILDFVGYSPA